jgi:FlaA1/EpsC-like NDP-sugar epimerase
MSRQHTFNAWGRTAKRPLALAIDSLLLCVATWIAFSARLETFHLPGGSEWMAYALPIALALPVFGYFGLYRTIVRYSGMGTFLAIAKGVAVYSMLFASALLYLDIPGVPRTLGVIQPLLALLFIGTWRVMVRLWFGSGTARGARASRQKVLIYGAGAAGRRLLGALQNSPEMRVVGFVDDDPYLQGSSINGVTIHPANDLERLVRRRDIEHVLLAIPSLGRARRNEIINDLQRVGVHVRTLPGLADLARGPLRASDLRELDVEDLLGRETVRPVAELMPRHTTGQVVLVTGAGGSIGSEICRQIATLRPQRLVLLDHSEYALYSVHRELTDKADKGRLPYCEIVPVLGSVRDEGRISHVMREHAPHIVYHAAAYKHVPMLEENVVEGVSNNVFGTWITARAAHAAGVSDFVLVSTDKAVRPTNVMGASKRLAEMALQALSASVAPMAALPSRPATRFSMVRFGNVLGSSGSVVPLFRQQIRNGGPVTLTHPDVTRYFMTIPEAAQLVVQAGAMARGGEVFVLDMGAPVRIVDLARRMIELSGLSVKSAEQPDGDIEITVTGLRAGEKLYEELLIGDNPMPTDHPRIMKAREGSLTLAEIEATVAGLRRAAQRNDAPAMVAILREVVAGFVPSPSHDENSDFGLLGRQRGSSLAVLETDTSLPLQRQA